MRGSSPGERRGGRRKGTPNRAIAAKAAEIAASGMTPLDYMVLPASRQLPRFELPALLVHASESWTDGFAEGHWRPLPRPRRT